MPEDSGGTGMRLRQFVTKAAGSVMWFASVHHEQCSLRPSEASRQIATDLVRKTSGS